MAFQIHDSEVRSEIDNRVKGPCAASRNHNSDTGV